MSASREVIASVNKVSVEEVKCENCRYFVKAWSRDSKHFPFAWCEAWDLNVNDSEVFCSIWEGKD